MDENILERNNCIIWHENPQGGDTIITCLKEGEDLLTLRGIQAWLWFRLSQPRPIEELKDLFKNDGEYSQFYDELERTIKVLVEKKVLTYRETRKNKTKADIPQKYKNIQARLLRELNSAKNFGKSEDLNIYHKNSIHTSDKHFETKEATISHVYREPHLALGGLSYGAKLYRKINSLKKIRSHSVIVEVGAGLGFLARSFIAEYQKDNDNREDLKYIFCDLTFKFLESQREINKRHYIEYCQANAEKMPFKDDSIDLIIANENIADFTAVKLNKKMVLDYLDNSIDPNTINDDSVRKSLEWIKSSSIHVGNDTMPEFIFNLGAIEFIKEIARVLKGGGLAFVAEYGSMEDYPTAVPLSGHVEYAVQFNNLIKVINALRMKVKVYNLLDFFEFNKETEVIDSCSLKFLSSLLRKNKIELPFLAYTREMLKDKVTGLITDCHNLKFFKITQQSVFHSLNRFCVLLISKD